MLQKLNSDKQKFLWTHCQPDTGILKCKGVSHHSTFSSLKNKYLFLSVTLLNLLEQNKEVTNLAQKQKGADKISHDHCWTTSGLPSPPVITKYF